MGIEMSRKGMGEKCLQMVKTAEEEVKVPRDKSQADVFSKQPLKKCGERGKGSWEILLRNGQTRGKKESGERKLS